MILSITHSFEVGSRPEHFITANLRLSKVVALIEADRCSPEKAGEQSAHTGKILRLYLSLYPAHDLLVPLTAHADETRKAIDRQYLLDAIVPAAKFFVPEVCI